MKHFYLPTVLVVSLLSSLILAQDEEKGKNKNEIRISKTSDNPTQSVIDINNITCWIRDDGFHDQIVNSAKNGAFPRGSNLGAIFSEGIVWGGKVIDGTTQLIRVNGNTYRTGCKALTRLFRVRPGFQTADLTDDASDFFNVSAEEVTQEMITTLKQQYEKDWMEWPSDLGASYHDRDGNGKYDPDSNGNGVLGEYEEDIPGIPGASQTIFIMYNDENSISLYGSPPIGLEVQETYWAYAYKDALENVIFKKIDFVYKGTPTSVSNSKIDSMYVVQWVDPDLGYYLDDFAGCDRSLNLGYAYNAKDQDSVYQVSGFGPPAVGYDFLQGVSYYTGNLNDSAAFNLKWRKGYKYINPQPMSSFIYFASHGNWADPEFNYDNGTLQFYNLMRGKKPEPHYPSGEPFPDGVANITPDGTYLLDGDPVAHTGKLDGNTTAGGDSLSDRRIMVVNGPFNMKLGDTTEVVLALVAGLGNNNLDAITAMKANDGIAQMVFDRLFPYIVIKSPNGGENWTVGSNHNIMWTSSGTSGNVKIEYTINNGSDWNTIVSNTTDNGVYQWTIPNTPSNSCKVRISDINMNIINEKSELEFVIYLYPSVVNISVNVSFGDTKDISNYRLIGIPGNSVIPISLNGEYEYDWQVYWDNGNEQNYLEQSTGFSFAPGKAYWIISKNPLNINQEVNAVPLNDLDNTYSISLHPGWNLISTPFERSTNWSNVIALNGLPQNKVLYSWNRSWNNSSEMKPYEGYYYNNGTVNPLTSLKIPYDLNGSLGKNQIDESFIDLKKFLGLSLSSNNKDISSVFIGIEPSSRNGFDENDYYAAPGDFQKTGISLVRNELPERDRYLFIEQRPGIGEGQEYNLELKAIPNRTLTLEVDGIKNFDEYNIYLLDERLKNLYNIKEKENIELELAHQYNPFKLFIGTDEYISEIKQNIQPFSYELFQNYPNPFNPNTTIRFSIPEAARVSLRVYNILGEVVTTLVNNEIYDAGNHELEFNGKGLSSGVYIMGIETSKYNMQKKIIFLK